MGLGDYNATCMNFNSFFSETIINWTCIIINNITIVIVGLEDSRDFCACVLH